MPVIERIEEPSGEQSSPAPLPAIIQEAASYRGRTAPVAAPAPAAASAAESTPAQAQAPAPAAEAPKAEQAKSMNDEIIKVISNTFLDFRKKVTMMFKPEAGVIDDMIVTWQNRYVPRGAAASADGAPAEGSKEGKLNVVIYLKTIPDEKTGTQAYNSFTIDAKMNFKTDAHPALEMEAAAAAGSGSGSSSSASAAAATKKKSEEVASAALAAQAAAESAKQSSTPAASAAEAAAPVSRMTDADLL